MVQDFLLASFHHLLAFGMVAMLVTQSVLLGGPLDATTLRRLGGVDLSLGITATLLLVVGLTRVFHGLKGSDFYLHNPWFHAKLGAFLLAGLISLLPTLRLLRWRKALKANPAWRPDAAQAATLRRLVRAELLLVAVILVAAAGMARYGGLRF